MIHPVVDSSGVGSLSFLRDCERLTSSTFDSFEDQKVSSFAIIFSGLSTIWASSYSSAFVSCLSSVEYINQNVLAVGGGCLAIVYFSSYVLLMCGPSSISPETFSFPPAFTFLLSNFHQTRIKGKMGDLCVCNLTFSRSLASSCVMLYREIERISPALTFLCVI